MIPSSTTRLVEAISNTITAVKSAPFLNRLRASATAAYEQEELAMPNPVARAKLLGESFPNRCSMVPLRTSAWTIADRAKPKINDQRICQVMPPVTVRAWPMA